MLWSQFLKGVTLQLLIFLLSANLSIEQTLNVCPEDESVILTSFYNSIAALNVKQGNLQSILTSISSISVTVINQFNFPIIAVEENELFDFRGLRMDWCRLQVKRINLNEINSPSL